jgi:hypothetical protein
MRSALMTLGVALLVVTNAQQSYAEDQGFGVKGGFVGASLSVEGPGAFDTNADPGPVLGGFVGIDLTPGVRLQPEVLFARRRFQSPDFEEALAIDARVIEVPVLVHKRFNRRVQPVIFAGPQLGIIFEVRQRFGQIRTDISREIRDVDFGVVAGAGLEARAGRGAIVMEGRVNAGFRDLSEADDTDMKSRGFLVLFGYRF